MSVFKPFYIPEPDLIFGGSKEEKDPRLGLKYHGPFYTSEEKTYSPKQTRLGIIGSDETIFLTNKLLEVIRYDIKSDSNNRWLFPDYPGASINKGIRCELCYFKNMEFSNI